MKKEKKVLCISVVMFVVALVNLALLSVPCAPHSYVFPWLWGFFVPIRLGFNGKFETKKT